MFSVPRRSIAPFLAGASWICWGAAAAVAATSLFCHWGVNAAALGKYNMGLAILLSFTGAVALGVSVSAAPVLGIVAVVSLFFQRGAGLRFLAAGATAALPIVVLSWLGPH